MYERPSLTSLGSLRSLTQYGFGQSNDLLGIWLNAATAGTASGASDGCTQSGNLFTTCLGGRS